LENRRSAADFAEARKEYEIKRSKLHQYIQSSERFEHETLRPYMTRLDHGLRVIEHTSYPKIGTAIKKTLAEWSAARQHTANNDDTGYYGPRPSSSDTQEAVVLDSKEEAEDFLRSSQLHLCSSLDQDYWGYIEAAKGLAEEARISRLQDLGKRVDILGDYMTPNYLDTSNKVVGKGKLELQEVTFQHIKHLVSTAFLYYLWSI
jgi:hypothetical protein